MNISWIIINKFMRCCKMGTKIENEVENIYTGECVILDDNGDDYCLTINSVTIILDKEDYGELKEAFGR